MSMSNIDLGARSERTHKDKSINRSDVQMLEKNNKHMDLYYDKKSAFHTQKPKNKFEGAIISLMTAVHVSLLYNGKRISKREYQLENVPPPNIILL